MRRIGTVAICLSVAALGAARCGGSGAPSAPTSATTTPTTSTSLAITSVSPSTVVVSGSTQIVTVTGTNFQPGLTLSVTIPSGEFRGYTGSQIQSQTATSLVVPVSFPAAGTYKFEVVQQVTAQQSTTSNAVLVTATSPWQIEGTHLTELTAGLPGQSIADSASLQLSDGRWRTFFTGASQIRSAISPDGLSMTMESGIRLVLSPALGAGALASGIKVLRLDDGRVRAYFGSLGNMYSAISTDEGLTFTVDPGVRLLSSSIGDTVFTGGGSVVRTNDGRWRMYFSGAHQKQVFSAVSTDLLSWSIEPGARVGGSATVAGQTEHPSAIVTNGVVSVFYFRNIGQAVSSGLYYANSSDGLTFTAENAVGITFGNDPDLVRAGSTIRMYYNWGNDTNGTIQSARFTGVSLAPAGQPTMLERIR